MRSVFIVLVLGLNVALGMRGFRQPERSFFTQHPFSDPAVQCNLEAEMVLNGQWYPLPLPRRRYRNLRVDVFTGRFYLEQIPYFEQGLTKALAQVNPEAMVKINCQPLYSLSYE